jgi:TonB family protein
MFGFLEHIQTSIHAAWDVLALPLIIWTVITAFLIMVMHYRKSTHAQIHYHIRLALIIALPVGIISALLLNNLSFLQPSAENELAPYVFFVIPSLIETNVVQETEITGAWWQTLNWLHGVFLLFLAGIIYHLSDYAKRYFLLIKISGKLNVIPISELTNVTEKNRQLGFLNGSHVRIAVLPEPVIPVTFGHRKPVVLLPEKILSDTEKLNLVLRHELLHIRNYDYLMHNIIVIIKAMFWFHPLVHVLFRQSIEYREMRIDSQVLEDHEISRKSYATLLLELIPMPNLQSDLPVNMAQESSNLKKRIDMMLHNKATGSYTKSALMMFTSVFMVMIIAMSCTDLAKHTVFDDEELNLLTDVDRTGERGYHQLYIFLSNDNQVAKYESKLSALNALKPEHIKSIEVLKGEDAIAAHGERALEGVVIIRTDLESESWNLLLTTLGMEAQSPPPPPVHPSLGDEEDYFVVVEEMPELIGGLAQLQTQIRYPEMARRAGIEGRVYVQFIVNEQGDVEKPVVIRGIGGGADEEALRAVSNAKFKPGVQRGQSVRVMYSLPIVFRLQNGSPASSSVESKPGDLTITGYGRATLSTPPPPPSPPAGDVDSFDIVEDMPELIGGLSGLQKHISYPEMAKQAGIEGLVYVQFIVNEQGRVENARVIRGIGGGADEEALRVINEHARFTPGQQRGRNVRVRYSIPIKFSLES